MKKLLSCVLVFLMILGTCTTSFAALLTDAEIAYVQGIVDNAKAEINDIIDVAKNGTDAEKLAMVDEYVDDVKDALVAAGFTGDVDAIEAAIRAEIAEIVAIASAGDVVAADEKVDAYIAYVKSLLDLTDEEDAFVDDAVDKIKDEIGEIAGIVEAQDDEAAKAKINAYINFLKETLNITAEDEAEIAEIVADVNALIDEIKGISADDVKAVVDGYIADLKAKAALEYAKLGHKPYAAEEGDLYVALGANVAGLGDDDARYYELVAEEYDITLSDDIANAALITYQVDAADVLLGALETEANWAAYFTAEQLAAVEAAWEAAAEVIAMDWEAVGALHYDGLAAYLKAVALEKIPAEVPVDEEKIDNAIAFVASYLDRALALAEEKKDLAVETVAGINPLVVEYAEKLAFAVVSYVVDTKAAIEEIQAINPDATLVVIGMYNNFDGVEVTFNGTTVDAGEYFAYAVDATNLYYTALAAVNGGFAFVNVEDASVDGDQVEVSADVEAILTAIMTLENDITANAAGHEYIKDQIVKAFACDYSVYEQFNETYHYVVCALCGDKYTEAHTFVGNTCEDCGYTKPVTPSDPSRPSSSGGGGSVASQFTIKFETNGGSKIANVTVKKGELLAEPAAPTKAGFVFGGWYTDKALTAKYNFSTPVTSSFTLYAKWDGAFAKFTDLDANAWYYSYVKTIVEKGLMNGISATEFAPNATLTRGMFVTVLYRLEGAQKVANAVAFTDVPAGQYYADAVAWANANGIVKGITDTEFAPNANVTREQMAAMLARYAEYKKIAVAVDGDVTYTDSAEISDYAKDAVKAANKLGILIGNADGSFAPKKNATRAEAAALFVRLLDVLAK